MLKLLLVGAWAVCCLRRQCLTYSIVQSKELNIAEARKGCVIPGRKNSENFGRICQWEQKH